MTSHKTVAYVILLSSLTLTSTGWIQAQTRGSSTMPRYAPPPAQREVYRPEPQTEQRRSEPENRQEYIPRNVQQEDRSYNNVNQDSRPNPGVNHPNVNVVRPQAANPAIRRAMTYNTRPGGVHILPEYFASHYGSAHGFHFNGWGPGCPTCGFTLFNSEWYFNWNGGNFGVMGQIPGNWALGSDYLYVDIGDDGNYYLYDAQFPVLAVQLTFVQSIGDDQAGAEQYTGNDGQ